MTPTEQDKELRKQLVETILSILGITDRSSGNRPEQIATLEQEIVSYIIADRKRVALEARIDEVANFMSTMVTTHGDIPARSVSTAKIRQRIAELKAQQEEV